MANINYYSSRAYSQSSNSIHKDRTQSISAESGMSSDHSVSNLRNPPYHFPMPSYSNLSTYSVTSPTSEHSHSSTSYTHLNTSDHDGQYFSSTVAPISPSTSINERHYFNAQPSLRPSNHSIASRSPPSSYYYYGRIVLWGIRDRGSRIDRRNY